MKIEYRQEGLATSTKYEYNAKESGIVFDIQRYSINDGPGIRTTVFLKGCPLRCIWCCNPESQKPWPELFYFDSLCGHCYRCVEVCPNRATTIEDDGTIAINHKLCQACGKCVQVCPNEARLLSGKKMTVEEVLAVVKKDSLFYRNSRGGVTLSGGEFTYNTDFARELLKGIRELGLHSAVETCGYTDSDVLGQIIELTDLILFDIKHMDPESHSQFTGVDNVLILENLEMVAKSGREVIVRMPLIPGYNDSEENLRATAEYISNLDLKRVDIIPYHKLGIAKYTRLGLEYHLADLVPPKPEEIDAVINLLKSYGLIVHQA